MRDSSIQLIYITSRGHSGSTLLSQLIGSHSRVLCVGEIKMLINPDPQRKLCCCHRQPPDQCPFWSAVQDHLIKAIGKRFMQLDLSGNDVLTFRQDNQALFEAVASVSGCSIIVDSSKSIQRAMALHQAFAQHSGLQINILHLHRGPLGSLNSALKKGDDLRRSAYNYNQMFFRTREYLKSCRSLFVTYERLATRPRPQLQTVMEFVGLSLEEAQFNWRAQQHRDIHGNIMRFGTSDRIRLDRKWLRELSWRQILVIMAWTMPVRLRSEALFERMRDWIKYGDWQSLLGKQ